MKVVTIGGRRWELEYGRLPKGFDAACDAPTTPRKRITIRPSLKRHPKRLLDVLIHEALHAAGWPLSEEFVEEAASDIARLLWSQGFRLQEPPRPD